MAEKPPEEGYISVVDEEPEILQLLKWDNPPQIQKQLQMQPQPVVQTVQPSEEQPKSLDKNSSRPQDRDPFDLLEPEFIETYRLSKDLARTLCEELKEVMPESSNKSSEFPTQSKIMAALSFYATGKYQKSVADKTDPNLSQHIFSTMVVQVTEAMNHPAIVKKYIHFPHLREERDIIKTRFYMKYGVPNVIGCVDCTHVPIAVLEDDQKGHFNKSFHSKKVQIICDSDLNIMSVSPSPGSQSHDGILSRHAVRNDLDSLSNSGEPCWLIGGSYYSQKRYIMTPIPKITKKSPVSPEKYYNTVHAQTHSTVTDTIKHLKSRWKCLQTTSHKHFDTATISMIIVACCVLNNLCNRRGLPVPPMTQTEERLEGMKQKVANGSIPKKLNDDETGVQVRAQLVERLWNERRVQPDAGTNGPKKRAKKDVPPPPQPPPAQVQMHHNLAPVQVPVNHQHQDDASKRARMSMNTPSYTVLTPVWGHPYHQHH